jgi:hypothetical protein
MTSSLLVAISALTPAEFENLTYDLVRSSGLKNVVWRTPGADGGRDMEGEAYFRDLTGNETMQRWYVECKRYSSSVDWPTVWNKIAYADSHGADVLLLCTNSNPSPNCETEIAKWNSGRRRPLVRVWRGYEFKSLLAEHSDVAIAYGLVGATSPNVEFSEIQQVINHILHAAYVTHAFDQNPERALEAGACLNELVSKRLSELKMYSRFLDVSYRIDGLGFDWAHFSVLPIEGWEDIGLRAILSLLRYQMNSPAFDLTLDGEVIRGVARAGFVMRGGQRDLDIVGRWARIRINIDIKDGRFELTRY